MGWASLLCPFWRAHQTKLCPLGQGVQAQPQGGGTRSGRCNQTFPSHGVCLRSRGARRRLGRPTLPAAVHVRPARLGQWTGRTFVASSTLVSYSANRTKLGSAISPSRIVFQSRPWNCGLPPLVGGLLSRSCSACCDSEGWRDARGEVGTPRICSAKLERWGLGLELILRLGGGCERARDDSELLSDCSGDGVVLPLFCGVLTGSAIA